MTDFGVDCMQWVVAEGYKARRRYCLEKGYRSHNSSNDLSHPLPGLACASCLQKTLSFRYHLYSVPLVSTGEGVTWEPRSGSAYYTRIFCQLMARGQNNQCQAWGGGVLGGLVSHPLARVLSGKPNLTWNPLLALRFRFLTFINRYWAFLKFITLPGLVGSCRHLSSSSAGASQQLYLADGWAQGSHWWK